MDEETKKAKRLEALKIQRRYMKIMHTLIGRIWEIPDCCIAQFVEENNFGILSANYRELKHLKAIPPELGYVPCDKCMEKI